MSTAARYIQRYFQPVEGFSLKQLMVSNGTLANCLAASMAAGVSHAYIMKEAHQGFLLKAAQHVGVGVACLFCLMVRTYRTEQGTLRDLMLLRRARTTQQGESVHEM